jgi:hypothetical protein
MKCREKERKHKKKPVEELRVRLKVGVRFRGRVSDIGVRSMTNSWFTTFF